MALAKRKKRHSTDLNSNKLANVIVYLTIEASLPIVSRFTMIFSRYSLLFVCVCVDDGAEVAQPNYPNVPTLSHSSVLIICNARDCQ